jgi:argininosuccinate lyase
VAFREAYRAVGALVKLAIDDEIALRAVGVERAVAIHPMLDAEALRALDPASAVAAKESVGGTGPRAVAAQIDALRARAHELEAIASTYGTLDAIAARVFAEPLEAR